MRESVVKGGGGGGTGPLCSPPGSATDLPSRISAIEGVCRSVFGTVQHTVRHKRAEPSFVKKLAINTASVHFAIDKIRVVLQAWALIIRILYVTLLMTSRAMGLYLARYSSATKNSDFVLILGFSSIKSA